VGWGGVGWGGVGWGRVVWCGVVWCGVVWCGVQQGDEVGWGALGRHLRALPLPAVTRSGVASGRRRRGLKHTFWSSAGAGAISTTFWWRRCTLQSRS
jgi:hypothetical protein